MVPRIGPTHGVHPAAKANPNTKDNGKLDLDLFGKNFFSKFNERILVERSKNIPKETMIIPPIKLRLSIIDPAAVERTLLIKTPKAEKTTENPSTKNTVFNMTFVLLIVRVEPVFELSSDNVVPEIYARKAGIMGRMQGATNDPTPANSAINIVTSAIRTIHHLRTCHSMPLCRVVF